MTSTYRHDLFQPRQQGMRVLVACEYSGIVRNAFLDRGHDAWSCDLLPSPRTAATGTSGAMPAIS